MKTLHIIFLLLSIFIYSDVSLANSFEEVKKLAESGNKDAQYNLGLMYYEGENIETDYEKAVYWITKSAEQGYAKAQYSLGMIYYKGENIDIDKAHEWFQKAAEQGHVKAQFKLGYMYYDIESMLDFEKARKWFQKAAEQNHPESQYFLGLIYKNGTGINRNIQISRQWMQKACNNGEQRGCVAYEELKSWHDDKPSLR